MTDIKTIGLRISAMRQSCGMTREQLADLLDVTSSEVESWESGEALPDILLLSKLTDVFGESVDSLLSSVNNDVPKTTQAQPVAAYNSGRRSVNPRPIQGSLKGLVLPSVNVPKTAVQHTSVPTAAVPNEVPVKAEENNNSAATCQAENADDAENGSEFEIVIMQNGKIIKSFPSVIGETTLIRLVDFAGNLTSALSVEVEGNVYGNVTAGEDIEVSGNVIGNVQAGGNVKFGIRNSEFGIEENF